jgi:hypothetical protein
MGTKFGLKFKAFGMLCGSFTKNWQSLLLTPDPGHGSFRSGGELRWRKGVVATINGLEATV